MLGSPNRKCFFKNPAVLTLVGAAWIFINHRPNINKQENRLNIKRRRQSRLCVCVDEIHVVKGYVLVFITV